MLSFTTLLLVLPALSTVLATPTNIVPRAASCTFPSAAGTSHLSSPKTIAAGASFDGGNYRFDRSSDCDDDDTEGGDADAVFLVEEGATVKNVIIGADQHEGIHCLGSCTLQYVWFEDVCEDAITIKGTSSSQYSYIIGGGAKAADDKVVQHNGAGTVKIDSYCVQDFGKLYRSCGNCSSQYKRTSLFSQINASDGGVLAGINSNYGDTATFDTSSIVTSDVDSICDTYKGNSSGDEPTKLTSNTSNSYCKF